MIKTALARREFVKQTASWGAGLLAWRGASALSRAAGANHRVRLGVMGANSRGSDLARGFVSLPDVEIAYVCDVDERAIGKGLQAIASKQAAAPQRVKDFRRILDDASVDALVIATPDHWHGPATILACNAGKHVYVEKPACHNPREGELMIAAARRHQRVVQLGTQRRSMPAVVEAIDKVRSGALGKVLFSRGWYNNTRGSIGRGQLFPVPPWLDWELWQGPAPERPYRSNVVHYNWHWFWHWGTGEAGNNGIHALDLCRWGLGVDYPRGVTSGGGRYHFQDDQETPDTQVITFDFGDKAITFEGRSCHPHGFEGLGFGAAFYGEQATLVIDGSGYRLFDLKQKETAKAPGPGDDAPHLRDFLDCLRTGKRPRADIEEGHKSTLLCHLGNLAYRTAHALRCDPATGRPLEDPAADQLWTREYRPGWQPA